MLAGKYHEFDVLRESDLGWVLGLDGEEYMLHKGEAVAEPVVGEKVEAFLYYDSKKRLTATTKDTKITTEDFGWVTVAAVRPTLGIFVDIGISKEILIAPSDLPIFESLWPQVGDRLFCYLKESQSNYLFGVIARPQEFGSITQSAPMSINGKKIEGWVIRTGKIGTNIITEEGYLGFIHESERYEEPRLGQLVEGRVVRVKEDGEINVSLKAQKEVAILEDGDKVFEYLQERRGGMPIGDKSSAELIKKTFGLSKSAFKRALGKLMKEGKIYQEDGWTYLKEEETEV
ncbi:MAG: S1-like domain-containing RNA-binding protein [Turicibacter sp.]|nr:S1-like domain-containing RNA-binding protein [Turicibacter sp.]